MNAESAAMRQKTWPGGTCAPRLNRIQQTAGQTAGFTVLELMIVIVVGAILTAIATPVVVNAMARAKLNGAVSQLTGAISAARYQAIKNSQPYTLALTTPANTYVVTNMSTAGATVPVPLPKAVSFGAGTYTFMLCPNGMVYGGGALCPPAQPVVIVAPPALTATYRSMTTNISVSEAGNVTTQSY